MVLARTPKKLRRDMKGSEVAADDAERTFEKVRKELKAVRQATKKSYKDLLKAARDIKNSGRSVDKLAAKRWTFFDACMKKKIRDSLSLKKENEYALPLGCVSVRFVNVEPDLFAELLQKISDAQNSAEDALAEGGSDDDQLSDFEQDGGRQVGGRAPAAAEETDDRRALVAGAIDFALERQVDKWNARPEEGHVAHDLDRAAVVRLWKRSNTRGGSFQMKKMNHVIRATLSYKRETGELAINLNVVEGEPKD